jgi:chromosomal replication initiator protein
VGILDWIKGRKRKASSSESSQPVPDRTRRDPQNKELSIVMEELDLERKRNKDQENRIQEMEERFNALQARWASMLENQQDTMLQLMNKEKSRKTGSKVNDKPIDKEVEGSKTGKKRSTRFSSPILENKTFDNFVVDDSNRFPFLASEAVAVGKGRKYNPLFIYGPVGVGKTHLLHAIANKMRESDPNLKILYSSTERFTDELIRYLDSDDIRGFRNLYQDLDVLLVDDIQMLSGREATQKEFFHMFNYLYNSGKQVVLCSDRPPSDILELETRLRSRFEGGLIIDIQVPTFEGRRQILVNLSQREGFSISTEVLDYLAFYLDTSVRELEGGFNRVTAFASLMKEPITVILVRRVLQGILQKRESVKKEEEIQKEELRRYAEGDDISGETGSYPELDLEEETDMIERELLSELRKE